MTEIKDLFAVSGSNTGASPLGAPERHDRDQVNDITREVMGKIRRQWEGLDTAGATLVWKDVVSPFSVIFVSATAVLISGVDATGMFPVNRKVKVTHASGNPVYAFVVSSSFAGGDTTVNLTDFDDATPDDAVRADANNILMFNSFGGTVEHGLGRSAFSGAVGAFEIPTALTAAAINTAIVNAVANDRIVLLRAAVYLIETPIIIKTGARLWGLGQAESILRATTAGGGLNDDIIKIEAAASHFELRSFSIDGTAGSQSAGNGIRFQEGATRVLIDDVFVSATWEHGIALLGVTSSYQDIHIRNVQVGITGGDCIRILEPSSGLDRCSLHAISVLLPGTGGAASATANGFYIEGRLTLSDLHVDLDSAAGRTGAGIYLADVGVGGSPLGGRCTLTGFTIEGTAQDMVGLRVGGVRNAIGNGVVKMTGLLARPLLVDGRGGGVENAVDNTFSNCIFDDGVRNVVSPDAPRTTFTGCTFQNQSAEGLRIDAPDLLVKDSSFLGQQADGIIVRSTAADVEISGCTLRDQTNDGIDVQAGASGTVIFGNVFRDIVAGNGVDVLAAATDTVVRQNRFDNCNVDVADAGTGTIWDGNSPPQEETYFSGTGGDFTLSGTTIYEIVGLTALALPGLGGNGTRKFVVDASVLVKMEILGSGIRYVEVTLYMGPAGTSADTAIARQRITREVTDNDSTLYGTLAFAGIEVTPATGDRIGFAAVKSDSDGFITGNVFLGTTAELFSHCRVRKARD